MTAAHFDRVPFLAVSPLETAFPYLSPDTPLQASSKAGLDCARVAILGSLKASRFIHGSSRRFHSENSPIHARGSKTDGGSRPPSCAERHLHLLLSHFVFQRLLLQHLTTPDLIALRQTSRFLRVNLDRERALWRTLNLSSPRHPFDPAILLPPSTSHGLSANSHYRLYSGDAPPANISHLSQIAANHIPGSPISPYHHMRVLILDNYRFPRTYPGYMADALYALFSNDCVRRTLKLLSIRGAWNVTISQVAAYLRDWEIGIRGDFRRDRGWRYVDTVDEDDDDCWRSGFQVVDKKGKRIPRDTWWAERGWALEVFRFAGPRLFMHNANSPHARDIPAAVPSYLHLPAEQAEIEQDGTQYYRAYKEFLVPLPLDTRMVDDTGIDAVVRAMRSAARIGVDIDLGFCKNEDGHVEGGVGPRYWAIAERRWEQCVLPGCRWQGWTEACANCRWRQSWCCRGCYGWVCRGCRDKRRGDYGARGVWCGASEGKCAAVDGGINLEVEAPAAAQ
ncbi:hypothetical protein Dda_9229 [Drechslerella dactyloides]|uniref:F-box domain-containing protein n=1 Tax=Drechslerella dactyloides TaxID=74499 RepID=A0AAD6NGP4_DREDA|nr:hypothetical protein Dda_9229 [Drechslerella dactyloides]